MPPHVNLVVEGNLDAAVGERLLATTGLGLGTVYGKRGYAYIEANLCRFNQSAHVVPYLALADFMDTGQPCPSRVVAAWLPSPRSLMVFRVVVREIESWLLADRENVAHFLGVPRAKVPSQPELIPDPKQKLVNLARRSRKASVKRLLVPPSGSPGVEGPGYTSELIQFVLHTWDIAAAGANAPSLARCLHALDELGTRL
jgi:hypothetical protein